MWYTPLAANPDLSTSLNQYYSWPSSGFRQGISYFFTATKNTTERVGEEEQTINMDLGQFQAKEREFCDDFVQLFVHL